MSFDGYDANPLYYAKKLYMAGSDTPITNLVIPEGATAISSYAFYNCTSLESITIPASVTSIGYRAFYGCNSLTRVSFENKSGWRVLASSDATSGTIMDATSLENDFQAARYLESVYASYYWKKS